MEKTIYLVNVSDPKNPQKQETYYTDNASDLSFFIKEHPSNVYAIRTVENISVLDNG